MWNDDRNQSSDWDSSSFEERPNVGFGFVRPRTTPIVKILLLVMGVIFGVQVLLQAGSVGLANWVLEFFGLSFSKAVMNFHVWQFFTYLFLHGTLFHVLFNLFALWMFGCEVETALGRQRFLQLFIQSGIFAGVAYVVWGAFGQQFSPAVGASGAIMAILVVFTILAPNRSVLLFFMIPMKMKHLMWLIIGLDMYSFVLNSDNGIANTAHLGGALYGWLWFRYSPRLVQVFRGMEQKAQAREEEKESSARAEVDRLLEKIAKEGMPSLNDKERRFLEQASRRFYDSE